MYFTFKLLMTKFPISEGNHLYVHYPFTSRYNYKFLDNMKTSIVDVGVMESHLQIRGKYKKKCNYFNKR